MGDHTRRRISFQQVSRHELYFEYPPVLSVESIPTDKSKDSVIYTCPRVSEPTSAPPASDEFKDRSFNKRYLVYDAGDKYFDGSTNNHITYPYPADMDNRNSCPFYSIRFNSFFEGGNLQRAVLVSPNEYDLILRSDSNTNLGNQWFYFELTIPPKMGSNNVRFHILNCVKPTSLFGKGMRPLLYCKECVRCGKGSWERCGSNITYARNQYTQPNSPWKAQTDNYNTLSFTVSFHVHDRESSFRLSYCYPYTYSDLLTTLRLYKMSELKSNALRISSLCTTVGGRICPLLTITDYADKTNIANRPIVVLVARVHPGETPGSWVMQGILEQLLSLTPLGAQIRKRFVYKIVPMLNPDGAALGMSRCNLSYVDLNRVWKSPSAIKNPTIYHTKEMVREIAQSRRLFIFCDIHGHSREKDIFLYGCEDSARIKAFLSDLNDTAMKKYLSVRSCNFSIQKSREGTGRVVIYSEFRSPLSFTLEASCCGGTFDDMRDTHYSLDNYKEAGHSFVFAIYKNVLRPPPVSVAKEREEIPSGDSQETSKPDTYIGKFFRQKERLTTHSSPPPAPASTASVTAHIPSSFKRNLIFSHPVSTVKERARAKTPLGHRKPLAPKPASPSKQISSPGGVGGKSHRLQLSPTRGGQRRAVPSK